MFATTDCVKCGEPFTYERVLPRPVIMGRRNRRKLTTRTMCDGCRKNNRRANRTPEKGYAHKDESKRDKELREFEGHRRDYIFGITFSNPPWNAGPGIENPLEFE